MKYLFGPLPSRRLGLSLGIDILQSKTCTFDCLYCEIGKTTQKTRRRADYIPKGEVLRELHEYLSSNPSPIPEVITFSGSGEPTLHRRLGEMISEVKEMTSIPVAVITNSSLLFLTEVRDDLLEVDIILPSLDAVSDKVFRKLNHPEPSMKVDLVISGLYLLRQEYQGQIWLEILIVPGFNDSEAELEKLAEVARNLRPDRVHVHTANRPSPVNDIEPAPLSTLRKLAIAIGPIAQVVSDIPEGTIKEMSPDNAKSKILNIIRKRPGRVKDVSAVTGFDSMLINAALQDLVQSGLVRRLEYQEDEYYICN
jgi:wyosine [tRNA(Phe)-imidazoG37] synthetase (radical SAM superfamily)